MKDYTVSVKTSPEAPWQMVAEAEDNHQRIRRHDFAAVDVIAVRVHIRGVHEGYARVYEVRCYE